MFWELHENNREKALRKLMEVLTDFLFYAASQPGNTLDEAALARELPQSAPWLLGELHSAAKNRDSLRIAVQELFRLPERSRLAIAEAAAHDIRFDQEEDPEYFHFAVPFLPERERRICKNFFHYFYEVPFHRKGGQKLGGRSNPATRSEYKNAYYQANPPLMHACPVCMHPASNGPKEQDLEHYFPKSVYPALILHPGNLMFLCKQCNETYKGTRDALNKGRAALDKVFLPYQDTVKERAEITFYRAGNSDRAALRAKEDTPEERERVKNFADQYGLEKRWSDDINWLYEQLREACVNQNLTREQVREKLENNLKAMKAMPGFPDKYLEAAYTRWLCGSVFDSFYNGLEIPAWKPPRKPERE